MGLWTVDILSMERRKGRVAKPSPTVQLPIPSHFTQFSLMALDLGISGGARAHGLGEIERGSIYVGLGKPSSTQCEDFQVWVL